MLPKFFMTVRMSAERSGCFYSSRSRPARLVTYLEALEVAEEEPGVDHVAVLPPSCGDDGEVESDMEDVPDLSLIHI